MDFASIIAFLILYYLRPQEWIAGLETLRPVVLVFIFGIAAMLLRRRGFSPGSLIETPHDKIMLAYFLWMSLATASLGGEWSDLFGIPVRTAKELWENKNLIGFYFVVCQALHTRTRLESFLWWWMGMLLMVSMLGVGSEFGIDPMGSYAVTHGPIFKGRLALNNLLFNNPNELGHTIVPLLPLLYLLCIWKRPLMVRQIAAGLLFFPIYCVYLTKSKGSYLCGAFTSFVAFVFGRPKVVQGIFSVLVVTVGLGLLYSLPRMTDLKDPRKDEGIRGRLAAFNFGYESFRDNALHGKGNFMAAFKKVYKFPMAAHSSYNEIGAELGPLGLFLYIAAYYCSLRSLLQSKPRTIAEERIRRVLIGALAAFMCSSWMVDFAYHGTFFFLIACRAAYHRLLLAPAEAESKFTELAPAPEAGTEALASPQPAETPVDPKAPGLTWNSFSPIDAFGCLVLLVLAFFFWRYIVFQWGR